MQNCASNRHALFGVFFVKFPLFPEDTNQLILKVNCKCFRAQFHFVSTPVMWNTMQQGNFKKHQSVLGESIYASLYPCCSIQWDFSWRWKNKNNTKLHHRSVVLPTRQAQLFLVFSIMFLCLTFVFREVRKRNCWCSFSSSILQLETELGGAFFAQESL